ncbi:carbohydrate-binding protein [Luoshenia tenuis]|jgi:chitodextrinase|uniref:carbohydrate-binding protein n=1 Tax=Luoshenia tenuis TaxID=2763654 RepID=UPI003D8CBCA0
MDALERARQTRRAITLYAKELPDEQAAGMPSLFEKWDASGVAYKGGDRVQYNDLLYKCLTEHMSQESWAPEAAPSLWVRIDDPTVEWPQWRQPTGATDAYAKGDKVSHNGKHWISDVDANTWEPGVSGWTQADEYKEKF